MKLKILTAGDPVLREKARELSKEEILSPAIGQLIQLMKDTMQDAPGVGLAAPQIGQSIQLIVIEDRPEYTQSLSAEQVKQRERSPVPFHVIINPKITLLDTTTVEFYEGCISIPEYRGIIPRTRSVKVDCLNERAEPITIEATGWYARILQHEIDHLHGILCIDRMHTSSFTTHTNHIKYWNN